MKVKKIVLTMVSALILCAIAFNQTAYAATQEIPNVPVYFADLVSGSNYDTDDNGFKEGYQYSINNPTGDIDTFGLITKVGIVKNGEALERLKDAYCVRAKMGFESRSYPDDYDINDDKKDQNNNYIRYIDRYTDRYELVENNQDLKDLTNSLYRWNNNYDNILKLTDILFVGDDYESYKNTVLKDALVGKGIFAEETYSQVEDSDLLTADQVRAIQQAALWYFTNSENSIYHEDNNDHLNLFFKTNNNNGYINLDSLDDGLLKQEADALFKYLTTPANYASNSTSRNSKVYLYTNSSQIESTQPIIVIEKDDREFDLALRKYISKVEKSVTDNTVVQNFDNARNRKADPDASKLNTIVNNKSITTADYLHKKDPVVVKEGNVVYYKLAIYNEGEIDGRATKVVDQLPAGLKFLSVVSGNFESDGTYTTTNNKLTLVRKSGNTTNLPAYTSGTPASEVIEIKCEVTAEPDEDDDKILTNLAWIAEDYNDRGKKDRDSYQIQPLTTLPDLVTPGVGYTGKTPYTKESDLNNPNKYFEGREDDDDFEKIKIKSVYGSYKVVLVKEDKDGEQLNDTATFEVDGVSKTVTGRLIIANRGINANNVNTLDTYIIKETVPPDKYCAFDGTIKIEVYKKLDGDKYVVDRIKYYVDNVEVTTNREDLNVYLNTDGNIYVEVKDYQFDLALRKFITKIQSGDTITEYTAEGNRVPKITGEQVVENTQTGDKETTTAEKSHTKTRLQVAVGDKVTYTIRIYNEGQVDGYAAEVTDYLPAGLSLVPKAQSTVNTTYNWVAGTDANGKAVIKSTYLKDHNKVITAANDDFNKLKTTGYYQDLLVECVVNEHATANNLKNIAAITKYEDKNGKEVTDRDSDKGSITTNNYKPKNPTKGIGEQDDDDYENLKLTELDLALRKFITRVADNIEMTNATEYNRAPEPADLDKLYNGEVTTATYNHTKEPVKVKKGDYVEYTLRVFNEGSMDGYAREITDHLPEYLEYVDCEANKTKYKWTVSEDGRTITTNYLKDTKLDALSMTTMAGGLGIDNTTYVLDSTEKLEANELRIICRVKDTVPLETNQTNIAEISKYGDKNNTPLDEDRDSQTPAGHGGVELPSDETLPDYKKTEIERGDRYIPGQQDDDDFEKVFVPNFDLALRKFITKVEKVNEDNTRKDRYTKADYDARVPQISQESYEKLVSGKTTTLEYTHSKEPMNTVKDDIVTYTIRVYNEGNLAGYASEITDDIPEGVVFLPEDATNKKYGWKMYKEIKTEAEANGAEIVRCKVKDEEERLFVSTENAEEATIIRTDYLSRGNGAVENLIKALDTKNGLSDTNPDYKDVQVAFKVTEDYGSDRIIINYAQISDDQDDDGKPVDDRDSHPDQWIPDEDDQDIEKIKVPQFDLALRKWVTQAIVTENGQTTIHETGHQPFDDPEEVEKVELHRKKLSNVTVKFRYSIRVYNDGYNKETHTALPGYIAGYAKEVKDHIPEGLKFLPEDNPDWKQLDDKTIVTNKLANTLLKPGEFADVEVVLTWINGNDNLGLKINYAEISEDDNDWDVPDKDSTPDNMKERHEDDDDEAPVILSVSTGVETTYFILGLAVLITIAGGVALIKKFVM